MTLKTTSAQRPGRGRRGDGSITEPTRSDGTVVDDGYWQFPDPVSGAMRRTSKRGLASRREASRFLKIQTTAVDAIGTSRRTGSACTPTSNSGRGPNTGGRPSSSAGLPLAGTG